MYTVDKYKVIVYIYIYIYLFFFKEGGRSFHSYLSTFACCKNVDRCIFACA